MKLLNQLFGHEFKIYYFFKHAYLEKVFSPFLNAENFSLQSSSETTLMGKFNEIQAKSSFESKPNIWNTWWFLGGVCLKLVAWTLLLPIQLSSLLLTPTDGFVDFLLFFYSLRNLDFFGKYNLNPVTPHSTIIIPSDTRCLLIVF